MKKIIKYFRNNKSDFIIIIFGVLLVTKASGYLLSPDHRLNVILILIFSICSAYIFAYKVINYSEYRERKILKEIFDNAIKRNKKK